MFHWFLIEHGQLLILYWNNLFGTLGKFVHIFLHSYCHIWQTWETKTLHGEHLASKRKCSRWIRIRGMRGQSFFCWDPRSGGAQFVLRSKKGGHNLNNICRNFIIGLFGTFILYERWLVLLVNGSGQVFCGGGKRGSKPFCVCAKWGPEKQWRLLVTNRSHSPHKNDSSLTVIWQRDTSDKT